MNMLGDNSQKPFETDIVFENPVSDVDFVEASVSTDKLKTKSDEKRGNVSPKSPLSHAQAAVDLPKQAARRFKSFVKESLVEQLIFGERDVNNEKYVEQSIWRAGFGTVEDYAAGCGLLHPETKRRLIYDVIQLAVALYTTIVVPWRLAFNITTEIWSAEFNLDIVIDCMFVVDIVMNFFAYTRRAHTGLLITDSKILTQEYLRSWFVVDLVATLPFDYVLLALGHDQDSEEARNLRILRLLRIAQKAFRFARLLRSFKHRNAAHAKAAAIDPRSTAMQFFTKLLKLCLAILLTSHVVGCIWLHEGLHNRGSAPFGTWVDMMDWYIDSCAGPDICPVSSGLQARYLAALADTCKSLEPEQRPSCCCEPTVIDWAKAPKGHMYMVSMYWAVVTMSSTGYGDIHAISTNEVAISMCTIIIGTFLWASVIAVFAEAMNSFHEEDNRFANKLRRVSSMLSFLGADSQLRTEVFRYYRYQHVKRRAFENSMFEELPPSLRRMLVKLRFQDV
eukprot:SAG11_NODE_4851_length_1747_cov_0.873786_1_plen_505_part_01